MLNNRRSIRFALRASILMVLASLALAPGLARNHTGLANLLEHIVPTLQAPAITPTPPILSSAPEHPLVQPGDDTDATPDAVEAGKPAGQVHGVIAMQPATHPMAPAAGFSSSAHRPAITHGGIGSFGGAGSPTQSVAAVRQTFAPSARDDHSNPDVAEETDAAAPTVTASNPSSDDNDAQDQDAEGSQDRDTDEAIDEDFTPEYDDDVLLNGDKPTGELRPVVEVPEPSGLALLAVGLFCLVLCRHLPH